MAGIDRFDRPVRRVGRQVINVKTGRRIACRESSSITNFHIVMSDGRAVAVWDVPAKAQTGSRHGSTS